MKQFKSTLLAVPAICLITGMYFSSCTPDENVPEPLVEETIYEVQYGTDPLQKMDIYLPADRTSSTKVLIFVHGGGWSGGDKADYVSVLSSLHGNDFAIANIDYRLADQASGILMPSLVADVRAAVDFISANSEKFVISPDKFILAGHSAGGHLALYTAYHNNADGIIKGVISLAGPTDLTDNYFLITPDLNALIENLTGTTFATDSTLWINDSPITYTSATVPPTLLQYCGLDFTVPAGQGDIMNTALETAGAEHQYYFYPVYSHDMGTIFYGGNLPPDVISPILDFISNHAN